MANSPFSDSDGFRFRGKGIRGIATKTSISNIDLVLSEERYINGVELILTNHADDDFVKFQVVHPIAGVLDEFGDEWYVKSDLSGQEIIILPYPAKIPAGLTIRIVYNSAGTENDVIVRANLFLHKKT